MLVVDASLAATASTRADWQALGNEQLVAPPLMWSEAGSSLHQALWRGELDRGEAEAARRALEDASVEKVDDPHLGETAWQIAEELGVAKTYDAEYLALARLLQCKVVTLDQRLRRGADRLGLVISLEELS